MGRTKTRSKSHEKRHKTAHHKKHKVRRASRRTKSKDRRTRSKPSKERMASLRLLRDYIKTEAAGKPLSTDVKRDHKLFRKLLGKEERRRLDRRVKEGRPVRGKKTVRRFSDEKFAKGSGAVKRRGYDGTDMVFKGDGKVKRRRSRG